jgi:hypothetical protein
VIRIATKPGNEYSALQRTSKDGGGGDYPTLPDYAQPSEEWDDCPNTYERPNQDGDSVTYGTLTSTDNDEGTYVHTDGIDEGDEGGGDGDDDDNQDRPPDVPARRTTTTTATTTTNLGGSVVSSHADTPPNSADLDPKPTVNTATSDDAVTASSVDVFELAPAPSRRGANATRWGHTSKQELADGGADHGGDPSHKSLASVDRSSSES